MAGDIKWSGYKATAATTLTTELNSLANGSTTALSAEIDNTTNLYKYMDLELYVASAAFTGTSYVSLYVVPTLDGTNYPDWDAGASPGLGNNNYWVGDLFLKAATGAERHVLRGVLVPTGKFKTAAKNAGGVAMASSGNTVSYRMYNDYYA